ncbi:hypothetical protein Tco_0749439 [Tanacetum coccineum]|uniref:Uncharacterized protein n=1 Tax=Tanacetum coccineum TaxID=301880 RepID=A0ABQ4Z1Z0_9ASTR
MSRSNISYESLVESIGSSALPVIVPHPAPIVDSKSKPFEDPATRVNSDSDSFENPPNSKPLEDHVSPVSSKASDSDDKPHGSPDSSHYFGGSKAYSEPEEFSKEDPSEDDPTDASSGSDEPHAQIIPAPQTSPISFTPVDQLGHDSPVALYMTLGARTVHGPRKTIRPQPVLSPAIEATIARRVVAPSSPPSSPSSSLLPSPSPSLAHSRLSRRRSHLSPSSSIRPPHKRYRVSPTPALPTLALPFIHVYLLPPRKRFGAIERIETIEKKRERSSC